MLRIALDLKFGVKKIKGKSITVNRLIFAASSFGDFKRLAYLRLLILAFSQYNALYLKSFSILIGATIKGNNMVHVSILFSSNSSYSDFNSKPSTPSNLRDLSGAYTVMTMFLM